MANYEWESVTLGQNQTIQDIVGAATKASGLVTTNIGIAKTGLQLAQAFMIGMINPKVILLNAIADEIDSFVADFLGTGFYILEVVPTGMEMIPTDENGDPVKMKLTAAQVEATWAAADGSGLGKQWKEWAKKALGESNWTGKASKKEYWVAQGKATSPAAAKEGVGDQTVAETNEVFGIPMLTSSQVIAQMISAMDDKLDDRRPTFSDSADVGAIIIVIGFEDITKTFKELGDALAGFVTFFGGNKGLMTKGFQKTANLIAAPFKVLTDGPDLDNATIVTVQGVSGVRGTEETSDKLDPYSDPYNFEDVFEVNDFVVGPRLKFGSRVLGYISSITETTANTTGGVESTQVLSITGASRLDDVGWAQLSNGSQIQQAHYFENERKDVNQNTGEVKLSGKYNDFKYLTELTTEEMKKAQTKVELQKGKALLQPLPTESVLDEINEKINLGNYGMGTGAASGKKMKLAKTVVGTILQPKKKKAPPPNFKTAKLEDLLGDFSDFFGAINAFSNTIRSMAGDSSSALTEMIEFLDKLIKKLEELNTVLQKVLKIFTDGLPDGGVYVLKIDTTTGGNNAIKDALASAENRPPDSLDFAIGYMMLGGGANISVLNKLLAG